MNKYILLMIIALVVFTACAKAPEPATHMPETKEVSGLDDVDSVDAELNEIKELDDEDFALSEEDMQLLENL